MVSGSTVNGLRAHDSEPDIQVIKRYVERQSAPKRLERQALSQRSQRLLQQWKSLHIRSNILCCQMINQHTHELLFRIVCPSSRCQEVWRRLYEVAAHAGVDWTLTRIRQRFYLPDMEGEVCEFRVQGCRLRPAERESTVQGPIKLRYCFVPRRACGFRFLVRRPAHRHLPKHSTCHRFIHLLCLGHLHT